MIGWKVLEKGMKSSHRNIVWKKNKWVEHKGKINICESGLHGSKLLVDAIQYVTPGIICKVEYEGVVQEQGDKFVCSRMRVLETYRLTKRDWVEFSIYCASLCLSNFEKNFPDDKRPRQAIMAAKRWLKNSTKKNQSAARSAWSAAKSAAESARSAWSAAKSAAESAKSAAESAKSAVWSAAWSAKSAVWSAAKKKIEKKLHKIIGIKRK